MSHSCEGELPYEDYGSAIRWCKTADEVNLRESPQSDPGHPYKAQSLWVGNGEYTSQVNYCPYCGYKAEVETTVKMET